MRTRASRKNKIREASGHVVIDAVVAPQDGSGPGRSVRTKWASGSPNAKKAITYR